MNPESPHIFTGSEAIEIKIISELLDERPEFVNITIEKKGGNLKGRYNLSNEGRNYIIEYAKGLLEKKEAPSFPETEMNQDSPHIITGAEAKEIRKICELLNESPEFVNITIERKGGNLKGRYNLGIVKLSELDQKLGNMRIHNSLIFQHSCYCPEVENQPNST